jgi:hypothetical protein
LSSFPSALHTAIQFIIVDDSPIARTMLSKQFAQVRLLLCRKDIPLSSEWRGGRGQACCAVSSGVAKRTMTKTQMRWRIGNS